VDLSLLFVGTGGSAPSARRGLPAALVRRGGDRILFDCGEGTQRQLIRSVGLIDIDAVFITHFHADHWLGLPGMLKSFALRERERPLGIFGPPGLTQIMQATRFIYGRLPYELTVTEIEPAGAVERDGYRIAAIPVRHRAPVAFGYAIVEDPRPGQFDPDAAVRLGVTPGPDFGRLQHGEAVGDVRPEQVVGPAREGRKLVLSGDTAPCEALAVAAHRADVLVHEATFGEDEAARAEQTQHSTARQAAQLARDAEVELLALTHLSTRYAARELRKEARAIFKQAFTVRDFDLIEIPFPERGGPRLVGAQDRSPPLRSGDQDAAGSGVGEGSEAPRAPAARGGAEDAARQEPNGRAGERPGAGRQRAGATR
jgi:ribonuclease Z